MVKVSAGSLVALLLAGAWASPAAAQRPVVEGRVLAGDTGAPVAGVIVELLGPRGERFVAVLSDSAGAFRLEADGPGTYAVRAHHNSYGMARSPVLELRAGETRVLQLELVYAGYVLPPLRVEVEAAAMLPVGRESFEAHRALGRGVFIDSIRLAEKKPGFFTDALRAEEGIWPTLNSSLYPVYVFPRAPGGCAFTYVNPLRVPKATEFPPDAAGKRGTPAGIYALTRAMNGDTIVSARLNGAHDGGLFGHVDNIFDPRDLAGIELYREGDEVPPDLAPLKHGRCALIIVWTKAAWEGVRR